MREPQYFGKLLPERERMLDALHEALRPIVGDLECGQSQGLRLVMFKEGQRDRLKLIDEGKRREVLL